MSKSNKDLLNLYRQLDYLSEQTPSYFGRAARAKAEMSPQQRAAAQAQQEKIAQSIAPFTPAGTVQDVQSAVSAAKTGDYGEAGQLAAMAGLGLLPGGRQLRGIFKGRKGPDISKRVEPRLDVTPSSKSPNNAVAAASKAAKATDDSAGDAVRAFQQRGGAAPSGGGARPKDTDITVNVPGTGSPTRGGAVGTDITGGTGGAVKSSGPATVAPGTRAEPYLDTRSAISQGISQAKPSTSSATQTTGNVVRDPLSNKIVSSTGSYGNPGQDARVRSLLGAGALGTLGAGYLANKDTADKLIDKIIGGTGPSAAPTTSAASSSPEPRTASGTPTSAAPAATYRPAAPAAPAAVAPVAPVAPAAPAAVAPATPAAVAPAAEPRPAVSATTAARSTSAAPAVNIPVTSKKIVLPATRSDDFPKIPTEQEREQSRLQTRANAMSDIYNRFGTLNKDAWDKDDIENFEKKLRAGLSESSNSDRLLTLSGLNIKNRNKDMKQKKTINESAELKDLLKLSGLYKVYEQSGYFPPAGSVPPPADPTYITDPKTGELKPDIDTKLRPDLKPATTTAAPTSSTKPTTTPKSVKEADMEEGNAFGDAVSKAKEDGIQKGETIKVGGQTYPVKESQLDECGEMGPMANGMDQQEGRMSVNMNTSTDGNKSITITADGAKADELASLLRLSGLDMHGHEDVQQEPVITIGEEKDTRYQASTTPNEHVMSTDVQLKGGDGEVAGKEKEMVEGGSARFSDNPKSVQHTKESKQSSVSLSFLKEYESILQKKK